MKLLQLVFWVVALVLTGPIWLLGLGFSGGHWFMALMFIPMVGVPLFFIVKTVRDWIRDRAIAHGS